MTQPVVPANAVHLTLADVEAHAVIDDNVHSCPTRVISLENTLNGMLLPLSEAQRIAEFARAHDIRMHCDGARLWEAAAAGAGSLRDYGACFDTISLCFSKGLGAPIGSVLVGPRDVIKRARGIRKSIGGGLRQSGVIAAAARVAVDETFGKGPSGEGGLLKETHVLAKQVEKMWTDLGGKLVHPVQTNMVWLDLDSVGCTGERFAQLGKEEGLKLLGGRLITHYQIYQNSEFVLPRLKRIFNKAVEAKDKENGTTGSKSMYRT
jgi:threonine aldolase